MKKYLVAVKKIETTSMIVSENSGQKAILKVADLMNKCVEHSVKLDKTFDKNPEFVYKVKLLNNNE